MSSILNDTKHALGVAADNTAFDIDIEMHINSAFATLSQVGIGPEYGFSISGSATEWSAIIGTNKRLNSVKSYIYMKTKFLFDPPSTGYLVEAMKEQIREAEWRLNNVRETELWEPTVTEEDILDGGNPDFGDETNVNADGGTP